MKPPERFPKTNGLLRLGLTGPSARTSAEASRLCGLKLASRRVGHQTSSRDAASETCPCSHYMQGVEDALSYYHAVAATRGVESTSDPPLHHRRDSIVRDVPTPSTRRVPRAGAAALNTSSGRGRFDGARASRRGRRRTGDTSLSGRRRRASQPVAAPRPAVRAGPSTNAAPEASIGMRRRGAAGAETRSSSPRRSLCYFSLRAPSSRRCPG